MSWTFKIPICHVDSASLHFLFISFAHLEGSRKASSHRLWKGESVLPCSLILFFLFTSSSYWSSKTERWALMPEIQSYLQRRGLTLPGLGITGLLTLGAAFLNPFQPEPTDASGRRKPHELRGGCGWIPQAAPRRIPSNTSFQLERRLEIVRIDFSAVTSPNLLPKRHGDWHTHHVAMPSEPHVSGSFPQFGQTLGMQESGGPRGKGPPCHRARHQFFGNISVCRKLTRHRELGLCKVTETIE